MKVAPMVRALGWLVFFAVSAIACIASARNQTLRIVTYNIEDDIGAFSGTAGVPRPGLVQPADTNGNYTGSTTDGGVLMGIGEEPLGASNHIQPLDIVTLQETTSNSITVAPIVSALNTYYGAAGMYAQSTVQGSQSGGSGNNGNGNGPNAIVYNTKTLKLVSSVGVGTPLGSANGEYRQVMRYLFAPAGVPSTAANEFYVYVSHFKSGAGASNEAARNGEATIIRNDSATLPSNARILYTGDYNVSNSSEDSYQTLVGNGINRGVDPFNPTGQSGIVWSMNALNAQKTESSTFLSFRDDYIMMTSNVYNATPGGLKLVADTYHTFGNNGTISFHGSADSPSNTALNNVVAGASGAFISGADLKHDLTWAADHFPVVADFALDFLATCTWKGGGSSGGWDLAENWDLLPSDGDSLIFAGTLQTTTNNPTLASVGSITFNSTAGSFTLAGNALSISGGITNNSTNPQTMSLGLTLTAAQQINAVLGSITASGHLDNGGNLLTVTGTLNTTLSGIVSGAGGISKLGNGTLTLSGNNEFSGGTTIGAGTVKLGHVGGLGSTTAGLTINSVNSTFDLNGFSPTIGALNGNGGIITSGVAGGVTLTLGSGNGSGSYLGRIQNGSGTVSLVKTGTGTQAFSGNNNSYSGGTTVNAGGLIVGNAKAIGTGGLTLNSAATVTLNSGLGQAVALPGLVINGGSATPTAKLDIKNNKMVVNNVSHAAAVSANNTIRSQVKYAFDNFAWDRGGITSSTVQNDVNNTGALTAVGIMLNDDGGGGNLYQALNGTSTFGGQATDSNSVLMRYTYLADLDLDGVVTSQDLTLFQIGTGGGAPVFNWSWGDLDYDGVSTGQDITFFQLGFSQNFGLSAIASASEIQPVPEPSTLVLAAIGLAGMAVLARMRRKLD